MSGGYNWHTDRGGRCDTGRAPRIQVISVSVRPETFVPLFAVLLATGTQLDAGQQLAT